MINWSFCTRGNFSKAYYLKRVRILQYHCMRAAVQIQMQNGCKTIHMKFRSPPLLYMKRFQIKNKNILIFSSASKLFFCYRKLAQCLPIYRACPRSLPHRLPQTPRDGGGGPPAFCLKQYQPTNGFKGTSTSDIFDWWWQVGLRHIFHTPPFLKLSNISCG